jgi:hypothetical protein
MTPKFYSKVVFIVRKNQKGFCAYVAKYLLFLIYVGAKTNVGIKEGNVEVIPTSFLYLFTFRTIKISGNVLRRHERNV